MAVLVQDDYKNQGARDHDRRAKARTSAGPIAISFIRTVTVGPGFAPGLLTPAVQAPPGARGLPRRSADTAGGEFRPALRTLPVRPTGTAEF
jgi:hypothetical protein